MGYGHAKQALFDVFMETFGPAMERRRELAAQPEKVEEILQHGAARARETAEATMERVRDATGISRRV